MHDKISVKEEADGMYSFGQPLNRDQIVDFALKLQYKGLRDRPLITNPGDTKRYFQLRLADNRNEVFSVMFLTTKHHVIDCIDMFHGTLNSSHIYVRQIVIEALKLNAAALIVAHNHPSGCPKPSAADVNITECIGIALNTISVNLLDHIIIGDGEVTSLAETSSLNCFAV